LVAQTTPPSVGAGQTRCAALSEPSPGHSVVHAGPRARLGGQAAANLYSLIASCKLHSIDPERYLAEVIRIMPYWPRDRYLELAPAYWAQTRARLDPVELEAELGFVTVPPVPVDTAQQSSSN
jgi:IS66 C-terminal element